MRKVLLIVAMLLVVSPVMASVDINVVQEDTHGPVDSNSQHRAAQVRVGYTGSTHVRAFALNISVDNGCTIGKIRDFNVGENNSVKQGYGIFPGRFRAFVNAATPDACYMNAYPNGNYNPTPPWADPGTTGTGLDMNTIIVEMGYLGAGDSNRPAQTGTLFKIDVNAYDFQGTAHVTVSADAMRGGVVDKDTNATTTDTNLPFTVDVCFPTTCVNVPTFGPCPNMADVNAAILAANLTVGTITYEVNCACPNGTVLRITTTGCIAVGSPVNYVVSNGNTVPNITTPPVTKAAADAALTAAGFVPNGTGSVSCTGTYGYTLTQDSGCKEVGSTVNYTYETGKIIAAEVGQPKATAEQAWTGQGFTLGTATPVVSCPAGVILSQDNGCHAQGYAVNYSYSVAPTSPNIVNKTMSDANATLAALGITVGTITYEPNGLKTALTVDRQSPPAGTATCGPVNYVVDTNCLYATRVFSLYGTVTFTVTTAQVTLWNTLGRPNCWCCVAQKRGNGVYAPSSTASKTDALDFAAVKNAANWSKNDTAAANVCLDFNLSGKIDALDLAIVKNANNWSKVTGPGPLCQ